MRFPDERLLAAAIGDDDDRELAAACDTDPELAARFAAVRAEVRAIDDGLQAIVPMPDESYRDPMGERWGGLAEFYAPPAPAPSRASRWLRVLAPAALAAVALAVGIGIVADRPQPTGGAMTEAADSAPAQDGGQQSRDQESPETAPEAGAPVFGGGQGTDDEVIAELSLTRQIERFRVIVVARAGKVVDGLQRFTVVRELKGAAPDVLRLQVLSRAATAGALHVLFLDDDGQKLAATPEPGSTGSPPATASPSPSDEELRFIKPVRFAYEGTRALARELPPGTDPASILLP
jgi:hypothetical protein